MATTANYGWSTPDNSALVKDGASAIRTLGSSVDTTVKALSPGTTAGDIDYYTSSTAKSRVAIGTSGQVLTVSGGVPAWATATGGGMTLISTTTMSGTSVALTSIPSTYKSLYLVVNNVVTSSSGPAFYLRYNSDSSTNYFVGRFMGQDSSIGGAGNNLNEIYFAEGASSARPERQRTNFTVTIPNYTTTSQKITQTLATWGNEYGAYYWQTISAYQGTSAISRIDILCNGGPTFSSGTILLYGVN